MSRFPWSDIDDVKQWMQPCLTHVRQPRAVSKNHPFVKVCRKQDWPLPQSHRERYHLYDCESCQVTYRSLMNRVDRVHRQGLRVVLHIHACDMFTQMTESERQDLFLALEHETATFLRDYNFDLGVSCMNLWTREHKVSGRTYKDSVQEWSALPPETRQAYVEKRNQMKQDWLKSTEHLTPLDLQRLYELCPAVKIQVQQHLKSLIPRKLSPFHHFIAAHHIPVREAQKRWQELSEEEKQTYAKDETIATDCSDRSTGLADSIEEQDDDDSKEDEDKEDQRSVRVKRVKV